MIKGSFYILLFYFLGEMLSLVIHGYIPGSVIGMILLFLCLFFKIIKPENVKDVAIVITKNMAVFFIPACVGLMVFVKLFSTSFVAIIAAISVSTVLTIITVALTQETIEKRRLKKGNNHE